MFRTKQLSYPASPLTLRSPSDKSPYATSYPAFVVTTTKASDEYFVLYHIIEILSRDIRKKIALTSKTTKRYHPQDFSHGRLVVSYPKACIQLRFSNKFRDRR